MKVQELIEMLSEYPKETTVKVVTDDNYEIGQDCIDSEDWEGCLVLTKPKPGKMGEPVVLPHA